jgi:hypothetical protein
VPIAVCCSLYNDDPRRQRFVWVVVYASAAGFLATFAASRLPYALLFQGQPYRVLWILKVLQIPLGFLLIAHGCQSSSLWQRIVALALVGYFCITHYISQELLIFALAVPVSLCIGRIREESWWYAAARGLACGAIGWMLFRWGFFLLNRSAIASQYDLNEFMLFDLISPVFVLVVLGLTAHRWETPNVGVIRWAALGIAITVPVGLFAADASPAVRQNYTRFGNDIAFVNAFLAERRGDSARVPAIYCSLGRTDLIWTDLHATSYFGIMQTAGVMFNRQTADEIERRVALVNKFEMSRERGAGPFLDDVKKLGMENLFQIPFNSPEPTKADLARLCQEPGLDYVVIPHEFAGLYSATNGRVYVYECYKIRGANASSFSVRSEAATALSPSLQRER